MGVSSMYELVIIRSMLRSSRNPTLLVCCLVHDASPHLHRSSPYETSIYLTMMFRGCGELGKRIRTSSRVMAALNHPMSLEEKVIWLSARRRNVPVLLPPIRRFVWFSGARILRMDSRYEDTISRETAPCMHSVGSEEVLNSARW